MLDFSSLEKAVGTLKGSDARLRGAAWRGCREARSETSHAYDGAKAEEVMRIIPGFLASAQRLLQELKRRQAGAP